jgi:serine/threonine protein kinase
VTIGSPLGSGTFGTVYKSVDVDTGTVMAVKILKPPTMGTDRQQEEYMYKRQIKREVEALSGVSHVSRPLSLLMRYASSLGLI